MILLRLAVNAAALLVAAWLIPGIHLRAAQPHAPTNAWVTLIVVAVVFAIMNTVIRPVLIVLSLPLELLTLGLFTFVINALMLLMTSWIAQGSGLAFLVDGFIAALLGALVISLVSFLLN